VKAKLWWWYVVRLLVAAFKLVPWTVEVRKERLSLLR
jgi:hypothetical protein